MDPNNEGLDTSLRSPDDRRFRRPTPPPILPSWLVPRNTKVGSRHAVAAGHYLAASAAHAILEAGGNAVDAGCCAGIALAVLHADEVNFGGVAPIMIRTAGGEAITIDGLGVWPASIPADLFMREHAGTIPTGLLRTVVPAAPDAWITALREYGTMTFGQIAAASIRLAGEGFAVFPLLAEGIASRHKGYERWPANAAIYLPNGRPPRVGERFVQADLAHTLQLMVERRGPRRRAPRGGARSGARRLLRGRDRREDRPLPRGKRRLPDPRGPGELPLQGRTAGLDPLARPRRADLRRLVPGPDAAGGAVDPRGGRARGAASSTTAPTTSTSWSRR